MRIPTVVVLVALVTLLAGPSSASELNGKVVTTQFGGAGNDAALAVSVNAVAGQAQGVPANGEQAFLRYLRPNGSKEWGFRFGTHGDDAATAVAQDGTQRIYVAGSTTGAFGPATNVGGRDAFLRAYSTTGVLKWTRQFGSSGDDVVAGITLNAANGIAVVGWTAGDLDSPSAGGRDVFVRLYSLSGDLVWGVQFGSSGDDVAAAIANDAPLLVAGSTDGALPGQVNAGGRDAFAAQINATDGTVSRILEFGTAADDEAQGIAPSLGVDMVSGTTSGAFAGASNLGGTDAFVARLDLGVPTLVDVQQFGSASDDSVSAMDSGGGFGYVSGTSAGAFQGQPSNGGTDAWVAEVDSLGEPVWVRQFGTAADDQAEAVSADLQHSAATAWADVVGATSGTFPGGSARGGTDAFWSFQWPGGDALAQDVLLRGLATADTYAQANAGAFDGFTPAVAATMSPSYLWVSSGTAPQSMFEMSIGSASGNDVRLIAWSPTGRFYCIEESGGTVTHGTLATFDPTSCSGGW